MEINHDDMTTSSHFSTARKIFTWKVEKIDEENILVDFFER